MANPCKADGCGNPRFSNGFCRNHQQLRTDDKWLRALEKKKSPNFSKPKKKKAIAPVSEKRLRELAIYRPLRDKYLKDNPICECCEERESTELHHKKGRISKMVYNVMFFMAICFWCHREIHENSTWAYDNGYLISK